MNQDECKQLKDLVAKLDTDGLTWDEVEANKDLVIFPEITFEDYIRMRLQYGQVSWIQGKLRSIDR